MNSDLYRCSALPDFWPVGVSLYVDLHEEHPVNKTTYLSSLHASETMVSVFCVAIPNSFPVAATKKQKSEKGATAATKIKKAPLNMDVCVGANYYKTGEDPVIRPESEYPDWLWSLEPQRQLNVSPDSKQYWRRIRKKEAHRKIATLREKH